MKSQIMVLFDSASIRREALQYSIELAKRLHSNLTLLVILSFEVRRNGFKEIQPMITHGLHAEAFLKEHIEAIQNEGISVETAVRVGHPKSELLKYIAETGRCEIIVWGGGPEQLKRTHHWLVRLKDILECHVVTPLLKN
jgi:nucleotide-binding universal stress UspA family protein